MSESSVRRYRLRASWRLLGALLLGLIWGGKTASLIVKYYGSSIEAASGAAGLWAVVIAVAVAMTAALGILIDWAWWSDDVPQTPKTNAVTNTAAESFAAAVGDHRF